MLRVFIVCLLLTFSFAWPAAAESWVLVGDIGDGDSIWMDKDIQPVGRVDARGKASIIPGMFTSRYKIGKSLNAQFVLPTSSIVDVQTYRSLHEKNGQLLWDMNKKGSDGLLFNAILLRDYDRIMAIKPFLLKNEYIPEVRVPEWPMDDQGWRKVCERDDGSEAWIQVKSAQLSVYDDSVLPQVRLLVRRLDVVNGEKHVRYSYEVYDTEKRLLRVLKTWDKDGKPVAMKEQELQPLPVFCRSAAIGSAGYKVFVANREEIAKRGQFEVNAPASLVPPEWLVFRG